MILVPTCNYKYLDFVCLKGRFPSEKCAEIGDTVIIKDTARGNVDIPSGKTQLLSVHTPAGPFIFVTTNSFIRFLRYQCKLCGSIVLVERF